MSATAEKLPVCFALQSRDIRENRSWISQFLVMVERPDWDVNEVIADLMQAKAQLWGYMVDGETRGIWITRIVNKDVGLIWIAAGAGIEDGYRLFLEHTEPWFKSKGCRILRIEGRDGWQRVLPDFERVSVVLEKTL